MSETQYTTTTPSYPENWQIASDFNPNDEMMNLKGKEYLNVQSRMVWFIRDQRALIVAGLAQCPYLTHTELVELDRQQGWAHFKTTVRDVLGNESVAYGSESAKDFGDFIEKAATKSLGRALIGLGYGTQFAPELSEGEDRRPVDSPVTRQTAPKPAQKPQSAPQRPAPAPTTPKQPAATPAPAQSALSAQAAPDPTTVAVAKALTNAQICAGLLGLSYKPGEEQRVYLSSLFRRFTQPEGGETARQWNSAEILKHLADEKAKMGDLKNLKVGVKGQ